MILIGVVNAILGYCSYTAPSDLHERIVPDVPGARGSAVAAPVPATGCAPAIAARIQADMPGGTITACTPDRVTVVRGDHTIGFTSRRRSRSSSCSRRGWREPAPRRHSPSQSYGEHRLA